jgi:hypothetical protein
VMNAAENRIRKPGNGCEGEKKEEFHCSGRIKNGHPRSPDVPVFWPALLSTKRIFFPPSASLDFLQKVENDGRFVSLSSAITGFSSDVPRLVPGHKWDVD